MDSLTKSGSHPEWLTDQPHLSRRSLNAIATTIFIGLGILDLSLPLINLSILYTIPLLLLVGRATRLTRVWPYVFMFVIATYAMYFVKYQFVHVDANYPLLSYRLYNRTYVAITLFLLGALCQAWLYWQHERTILDFYDRRHEDEVNATAGILACLGLGLLIAAIDFVSPASFNLSILYAVPLYLSSWFRSPRVLWATCGSFVLLTMLGYAISPGDVDPQMQPYIIANRTLVIVGLVILSAIFRRQMGRIQDGV